MLSKHFSNKTKIQFNSSFLHQIINTLFLPPGTVRNGARCSTSKAFLHPVKDRPNLHIYLHSHVTKVIIDPKNRRAIGVEFVRKHQRHVVRARKEVILSGGKGLEIKNILKIRFNKSQGLNLQQ